MATLEEITIKGFKSIKEIDHLTLKPINVIIGPNGSGKSNFIGVFSFVRSIREGKLQEYVLRAGGAGRVLHFGAKTTPEISIEVKFTGAERYRVVLVSTEDDGLAPLDELVFTYNEDNIEWRLWSIPSMGSETGSSQLHDVLEAVKTIHNLLGSWRTYHFHDTSAQSALRLTNDVNDNAFLRSDGGNLAAYLYFLKEKYAEDYGLIRDAVRRVAPFFEDFVLAPQRLNEEKIRLQWRHRDNDQYFETSSLSDGTLRFIALATLLLQPKFLQPHLILIDEPELGLHPSAIGILASIIKASSANLSSSQIILSTQSPLLLDYFDPENVLVADRVDGGTSLKRLNSSELESWLDEYSLGQLWEKNEIGGRP